MIHTLSPIALCMTLILMVSGCSKPDEPKVSQESPEPTITEVYEAPQEEVPPPMPDEISVSMAAKYSDWTNSTNAVLMMTAEVDDVQIKTIRVNGGDCRIISKQHRDQLNTGQQNSYTVSPLCAPETVRRVDVSTSRGSSTFTF